MFVKTLLNRTEEFKSFVYGTSHFEKVEGHLAPGTEISPRKNAQPLCPKGERKHPTYDTQAERLYEYVPIWDFKVYFRYAPRRADCDIHSLLVERVPWAVGKERAALLKNKENLTEKQVVKLKELFRHKLRSVKGYLLREDFQRFWQYRYIEWAEKFLDDWTKRTMYSKLEPMKKVSRMLRNHKDLILNWFRADGKVSNSAVEGLNLKAKLAMRTAAPLNVWLLCFQTKPKGHLR